MMQYNKNAWEKLGDSFTNNYEQGVLDYRQNIVDTVLKYQDVCDSMLDIACADGWFIEKLREFGYSKCYLGVDITPNLISRAKERMPVEMFYEGNAMMLDFQGVRFDFVLCAGILMHIPDFKTAILEACRVSNKYVMFSTYGTYSERHSSHDAKNEFLNYFYTRDDIEMSVPSNFKLKEFKSFNRKSNGYIFQSLYEKELLSYYGNPRNNPRRNVDSFYAPMF